MDVDSTLVQEKLLIYWEKKQALVKVAEITNVMRGGWILEQALNWACGDPQRSCQSIFDKGLRSYSFQQGTQNL